MCNLTPDDASLTKCDFYIVLLDSCLSNVSVHIVTNLFIAHISFSKYNRERLRINYTITYNSRIIHMNSAVIYTECPYATIIDPEMQFYPCINLFNFIISAFNPKHKGSADISKLSFLYQNYNLGLLSTKYVPV